jgi:hypothetical protein
MLTRESSGANPVHRVLASLAKMRRTVALPFSQVTVNISTTYHQGNGSDPGSGLRRPSQRPRRQEITSRYRDPILEAVINMIKNKGRHCLLNFHEAILKYPLSAESFRHSLAP